jgi:hypothetical protein
MQWNWLSGPLRTHTYSHWLWSLLHSVHQHIAGWLLGGFVVVGVLQIVLAFDAGYLTVKALPAEVPLWQKRFHKGLFILAGMVLLVGTVMVGLLNDRAQSDADLRTRRAEEAQRRAENDLRTISGQVTGAQALIKEFYDFYRSDQLPSGQRIKLDDAKRLIDEAVQTAQTSLASQSHPIPTSAPPTPSSLVPTVPGKSPPTGVQPIPITPPAFTEQQREQFSMAAADAKSIVDSLRSQHQEAQDHVTSIINNWLRAHPDAKSSDPIPQYLYTELSPFMSLRPTYDFTKTSRVLQELTNCCWKSMSYRFIQQKLPTFENGDMNHMPSRLVNVGDLQSASVLTTNSAQSLWGMVQGDLTAAAYGKPNL